MKDKEFLRFLREKQGDRTQKSFAESIGVTPQFLSEVLSGKRSPGGKILSHFGAHKEIVISTRKARKK